MPLEDVQLDKDESHQPQEGVPEVQKASFEAPVSSCNKQNQVQESFQEFTHTQQLVTQTVSQLHPDFDFQKQHNQKPGARIDDINHRQAPGRVQCLTAPDNFRTRYLQQFLSLERDTGCRIQWRIVIQIKYVIPVRPCQAADIRNIERYEISDHPVFAEVTIESVDDEDFMAIMEETYEDPERAIAFAVVYGLSYEEAQEIAEAEYQENWYSIGAIEAMVLLDDEADEAVEDSLENYIEDCVLPEVPEWIVPYFDEEAWKRDARMDGRGHILAGYDGAEEEAQVAGTYYSVFRM